MKKYRITIKSYEKNLKASTYVDAIDKHHARDLYKNGIEDKFKKEFKVANCHIHSIEDVSGESLFDDSEVGKFYNMFVAIHGQAKVDKHYEEYSKLFPLLPPGVSP